MRRLSGAQCSRYAEPMKEQGSLQYSSSGEQINCEIISRMICGGAHV
jgi:hypothetical protein